MTLNELSLIKTCIESRKPVGSRLYFCALIHTDEIPASFLLPVECLIRGDEIASIVSEFIFCPKLLYLILKVKLLPTECIIKSLKDE